MSHLLLPVDHRRGEERGLLPWVPAAVQAVLLHVHWFTTAGIEASIKL